MTINRHNYEEFFMLYVDHELSDVERLAVEAFVRDNSDLEEELVMLQQSKLKPDHSIFFENKKSLLKQASGHAQINEMNYEEFFVLYVDGELSEEERTEVERFIFQYPHLRQELDLLSQTSLQPDLDIVFEKKEILFRHEEERVKPFLLPWLRFSAAAVVLLLAGLLVFNKLNRTADHPVAVNPKTPTAASHSMEQVKKNDEAVVTPPVAEALQKGSKADKKMNPAKNQPAKKDMAPENNRNSESGTQELAMEQLPSKTAMGTVAENEKDIQTGSMAFKFNTASHQTPEIIDRAVPATKEDETDHFATQASLQHMEDPDNGISILTASSGKTKMRGFFRKVSRVFEKNTGIGDADNKKSVLVGSIQIALK